MTPTPPHQPDDAIDRPMFTALLDQLVSRARAAGVALDGAYNVRTPWRDQPDYTVEITEIEKNVPGQNETAPGAALTPLPTTADPDRRHPCEDAQQA